MTEVELSGMAILIAFIVVTCAVSTVMLADVAKLRIPNSLWLVFLISGLLFHVFADTGHGFEFCLVGALLGFGLLFMPFLAGGTAARDLKLTAGVGAWLGPSLTIWIFACIACVAGLYHALSFLGRSNVRDSFAEVRILYCRLTCLMRYLAVDDGRERSPVDSDLDERLVSYTTAIFVSTLLMLGVIVVLRK
jgi:prepilin peptidase CpaA